MAFVFFFERNSSFGCQCGRVGARPSRMGPDDGADAFSCPKRDGLRLKSGGRSLCYALLQEMVGYPSGQRGQTVNLLAMLSVVRIHDLPPS